MKKTATFLMFAAIAAIVAVVGTVSVVPAQAQILQLGDNNIRNDQGACILECRNFQNFQNNQGDGDERSNTVFNSQ
jgi:hypothetical protein